MDLLNVTLRIYLGTKDYLVKHLNCFTLSAKVGSVRLTRGHWLRWAV